MDGEISSDTVMQNLVLKRKRSHRQRPWNSSSSSEDDILDEQPMMITNTFSSSSSEEEEEHQAAKCLMLLAQANHRTEFNSAEMLTMTRKSWSEKKINNGGLYECKTCNRTFQSFQALGGHRTSHKKMKIKSEELFIPQKPVPKPSEQSYKNLIAPIALHLGTNRTPPKLRVHQCLICNAVFASGQALGGHMRRHRVTVTEGQKCNMNETKSDGVTVTVTLSLLGSAAPEETGNETSGNDNDFQCLDLNFPVASDEIGESQFCFESKQMKEQKMEDSGLVFSSTALVDCQY